MTKHHFESQDQLYWICIGHNNNSGFAAIITDNDPVDGEEDIITERYSIKSLDALKSFLQDFATIPDHILRELKQDSKDSKESNNENSENLLADYL